MGYIFESEIEIIINTVRGKTIGEEETIRLRDVLASDIHPAIKAYFKAEVEHLLTLERENEVRSKKFPYSLPEIARLHKQIDLLLVHNYQFGQHDFEAMLDHAVHFQFNFLCRPQWTLLSFMFENQRRRQASEVERKLRYCVDYVYYPEIIRRYIEDRGFAEFTYEEFSTLLEKIDREIVATHSSVELALMARPMLKFIEAGQPIPRSNNGEPMIPINAAIVFFEDKKLNDIKERLEVERDRNQIVDVTLRQLAGFIEKVRTGNEEAEVVFPVLQADVPTGSENKLSGKETGSGLVGLGAVPPARPKNQPAKFFSDFEESELSEAQTPIVQEPPKEPTVPERSSDGFADAHTLFSPADQKEFIRAIFKRDEVEFRNALDRFNTITDWKDASQFIEQLFIANDVDPFSEEAILFTDRVHSRYLPTEDDEP